MKKFSPDQRDSLSTRLKLFEQFKEEGYELKFHSPYKKKVNKNRNRKVVSNRYSSSMSKEPEERQAKYHLLSESAYLDFDMQKVSNEELFIPEYNSRNNHFNS